MKKYTQEEYNELPIVDNFKQCPTGDYTSVEYFGEWCSFGKSCVYANINILNRHVYSVFGVGASKSIYGWLSADGWYFQIGCFFGTETQARESINKKYSSEHIYHDALNLIKKMEV